MQKKIYTEITAFLSAAVILFLACFSGVYASEKTATMTLICKRADTVLTGMNWDVYYVGQRTGNSYTLEGDFADYQVSIDATSTDSMVNAAVTLENYAIVDNIPFTNSGLIDEQGYLKFSELKSGLYLVSGHVFNIGVVYYQPSPVLVEIDLNVEDPDIDLIVYPKIKYALLSEIDMNNTVKKLWLDSKETHEPLDIEIYRNGDLFQSVKLSDENEWTYSWTATEYAQWRVKEVKVPADYSVNYQSDNGKYVIENTFHGVETPIVTTTTAPPQKLPQTGQLWWPVILMGSCGAVLIVVGMRLMGRKRRKV